MEVILMAVLARSPLALALAALTLLPAAAAAQTVLGNDEITGATRIQALPFATQQDTTGATPGADDPQSCWSGGFTVWYSVVAPADGTLRVGNFAGRINPETGGLMDIDSGLALFSGTPGALVELACEFSGLGNDEDGFVDVPVTAGQVVFIMAGSREVNSAGTSVALSVQYVRAPQVDVTVDRFGTVTRQGVATVSGTLRCDVATTGSVFLTLSQRAPKGGTDAASDSAGTACSPGATAWTLSLPGTGSGPLGPGLATFDGSVTVGEDLATSVPVTGTVVLRPELPAAAAAHR